MRGRPPPERVALKIGMAGRGEQAMASARPIDLGAVIEGQSRNGFVIKLILLSIAITFFDGFDMHVIAYTATYLTDDFGLSRIDMGNLFAAGVVGTMVGGFFFGYLGDRIGRRPAIVAAAIGFGILTLAFALARSYEALLILRFLNGIAIGGLLPLCWALNIEYVPSRYRATVVTVVMLGYTLGSSLGAPITIWLAPDHGWQAVYVFGGIATLVVAVMLALWLPESARFLAVQGRDPERIARYARRIAPDRDIPAGATFHLADEVREEGKGFRLSALFEGRLRYITPLLWMAYIASSMAIYFKSSWTPLVLEILGYSRTMAASYSSISAIGAALGGLLLMRFTDRKGPISIAVMSLFAVPVLLVVGLADTGYWAFLIINFFVNVLMGGAHYGMHSISGIFYPSAHRANGAGWATSVAKVGSIAGPLIGGFILATQFPVKHIFALLAVSPAVLALAIIGLEWFRRRPEREPVPAGVPAE